MNNFIKRSFHLLIILPFMLSLSACSHVSSTGFLTKQKSILSPSGKFIAKRENTDKGDWFFGYEFSIQILDRSGNLLFAPNVTFRDQDSNFILWAEKEDILWCYSGDWGTCCFVETDGNWVEYTPFIPELLDVAPERYYAACKNENGERYYVHIYDLPNRTLLVPELLRDTRPRHYPSETVFCYTRPDNCDGFEIRDPD